MSFFDIVGNSGTIGVIIWIAIFSMTPVGIVLGIISIFSTSSCSDKKSFPLFFKILIITLVAYFFIGFLGVVNGSFEALAALDFEGVEKTTLAAVGISNVIYTLSFTLLGAIPFMFFIFISTIILHFKQIPRLTPETLSALEDV